ncbi:GtrA family protein [Streptomyces alkaliterrae]|uniref:GtrA family protein n=1 Tax=Streptomyces alkaliterrae TaxID=2213162 RepID=A0A5P0YTC4_9ACTN|nr:GtrA family protein [Streptomyces alkaliterrae]MBB1254392.1 GtrA family protein [Streptomyces alkaliterrae]MBB1258437.1 GtrA family protein [Streptomyces alkaliterrae]MQS02877.1 GtrA family protein [Streptomyces alkaliterrae]
MREQQTPLSRLKRLLRELSRFGAVGGFGFLVSVAVFNLCLHTFQLASVRSGVIATVAAICCNYVGHRYFTYRHADKDRVRREVVLFLVFSGFGLVIENGILAVSHYALGFTSPLADNIAKNLVGLGVASAFRFWSFRTWVFRTPPESSAGRLLGLPREEEREDRRVLLK